MTSNQWGRLMGSFQQHQQAASRSPGTIRLYRYRLSDLAAAHPSPRTITTSDLERLLAAGAWSAETRKSIRTAYRTFFAWAVRAGELDHDPAAALPPISVPAGEPRPAPDVAVRKSLRVASDRDRFMILLGAYAGLRCCEIALVHADQWDGRTLVVVGKGRKVRRVPIRHAELVDLLDDLDGYAFPNRWTGAPITAGHVSKLLSEALVQTYTGHTLRHRYGTTTLEVTKDLLAVGRVMGHSRPETTQRYCVVSQDRLEAVAEAAIAA